MSSYINLLNDNDIHYHSVASDSKTIKLALYSVGALVALICMVSYINYRSTTAKAEKLRARWANNESNYEAAIKNNQELKTTTAMLAEVKGWPEARLDSSELLMKLQDIIPPQMQITGLDLQGAIAGIEKPLRRDPPGKSRTISEPERQYHLRLEGVVVDDFGEKVILDFVRVMQDNPDFQAYFDRVDFKEALPTIINHFETQESIQAQRFTIECQFKPRRLKWTGKA